MAATDALNQLKQFEEQYIPFPTFVAAKDAIESSLNLFRETGLAKHMLVLGEAGTGKSSLCRWLAERHPKRVLPERNIVEALFVATPPAATVIGIADAILTALDDPWHERGTVTAKTARIVTLCRECRVEIMLLDEAQHLHDRGDTRTHYMVGDWLKHLIDAIGIPTVMLGLPKLERLLEINDQLRRRFSRRLRLGLGQSDTDSVETECLQLFLSLVSLVSVPVSSRPYDSKEMGMRLYFASDGSVAYIKKLLASALQQALDQNLDVVDAEVFEKAFTDELWWEGIGKLNPFNPKFEFRRLDRGGEPFQQAEEGRPRKAR